jgi:hypothetical protein
MVDWREHQELKSLVSSNSVNYFTSFNQYRNTFIESQFNMNESFT